MPLRSLRGLIYDSREAKLTASTMLAEHLSLRIQSVKTGHYGNSKKKKKIRVPLWFCSNPGEGYLHPMLEMEAASSSS